MYEKEKKRLAAMVDFEKQREKSARRRHSAMLVADSLTNLASMYARSKGARYAMGTNMATTESNRLLGARENRATAQRNYNALMAELAFKNIIESGNPSSANETMPMVGKQQSSLKGYANNFAKRYSSDVVSANRNLSRWGRVLKNKING